MIDAWAVEFHFLVVRVAHLDKGVDVVAATLGLQGELASGATEGLGEFARGFVVSLCAVVYLERRGSVEKQRCRNPGVS